MCNIVGKINKRSRATVYKVACKKDGKYYSPATGIEYKLGNVTIPESQIRLTYNFIDNILKGWAFEPVMVGRTAGYIDKNDAFIHKNELLGWYRDTTFDIVVIKLVLSTGLYAGEYMVDKTLSPVILGKKIQYIKEINN
jgi:hypothetical protein